jgi:hypothetical protein
MFFPSLDISLFTAVFNLRVHATVECPLVVPNLCMYKQEWYNLFAARGERSLRVTQGADVCWMSSGRQKVRCVNRSQNTGSSRKDHFDLTSKANAKAVVANMWAADPNRLAVHYISFTNSLDFSVSLVSPASSRFSFLILWLIKFGLIYSVCFLTL